MLNSYAYHLFLLDKIYCNMVILLSNIYITALYIPCTDKGMDSGPNPTNGTTQDSYTYSEAY